MDYIISPVWFYWINVANDIKIFSIIAAIIAAIVLALLAVDYKIDSDSVRDYPSISERERKRLPALRNLIIISLVIAVVCSLVGMFTPSKQTLIEMMVAKLMTRKNAEITVEAIKSAVDYIVSAAQQMK